MVVALYSAPEPSSGEILEMRVLPHIMTTEGIDDFFEAVKIDEGENQWAKEFEQLAIRPADELADPGPRGKLGFTPAIFEAGAFVVMDDGSSDEYDSTFGTTSVQREDEHPKDESSQQQGSIDRADDQNESRMVCEGHSHRRGSRSVSRRRRQRRHNFVQADEHLRGHPHILYRHLCRSNTQPLE